MPLNRHVKKGIIVVLAAGAVAVAAETGAPPVAGGANVEHAAAQSGGNPNARPPILPPATPSELAEIRAAEYWDGLEFYADPSPTASWSNAEMNAYANAGK